MKPVLYAEDDVDDVFFLRYAWELAQVPHPLIDVRNGQQALDYLDGQGRYADRQQHPLPCLVLLDLNMPGKSGFEVLRWIRQHPRLQSLKVVVVSGSNQETDIETAQRLGATDYLVKPSDPSRLLEIIQEKKGLWLPNDPSAE